MSQWSHRAKLPPDQQDIVQRLQVDRGVSEPVARNLLKCALLGVGPLVDLGVAHRYVEALRPKGGEERGAPKHDVLSDLVDTKKRRMRQQEELLRKQEEQNERELQEEQRLRDAKRRPAQPRTVIAGLQRLGPVLARTEEVDPLPAEPPAPVEAAAEPRPRRQSAKAEERGCAEAPKKKAKKKRRRAKELLDRTLRGEALGRSAARSSSSGRRRRRSKSRSRRRKARSRSRSRSRSSERVQRPAGLMSEGDAKRRMQLEHRSERGSLRAQSRIQKELEEWEAAKRGHKEYWMPPRHRLCFQAENAKRRSD